MSRNKAKGIRMKKRVFASMVMAGLALSAQAAGNEQYRRLSVDRLKPTFIDTGEETLVASAVVTEAPYSADPTGAQDATLAIQKALDAVAKLNGGVVYLPAGKYRLNGSLRLAYGVSMVGVQGNTAKTLLLAYYGRGEDDKLPLINAVSSETGIIGINVFYPEQKPEAIVPYATTLGGEIKTIKNVTLFNSFRGIEPRMFNGVCFANIRGTVLASGMRGVESTEFAWMHDVVFTPQVWINAAQLLTGRAMTPGEKAALTAYVASNCSGLELGRIDGLAITRFSAEGAKIPVLIKRNPKYNDSVHGFGGVVDGFPAFRNEVANGPWYYGMHYANVDNVPEAKGFSYTFARTPRPLKTDSGSFFNVTVAPFYASGDGIKDDTEAIVKALAAAAKHGGGTVYLPQGEYKVTRPLTLPRGVELRGAMGTGKIREAIGCTTLAAYCGKDSAHPETDAALITLSANAGIRGLSIAYPEQAYDVSKLVKYPYTIRGAGPNVYVLDLMLVNACYGIDFASASCDNHFVRSLWGTTFFNGIAVGGGSKNGKLEHICFSYGPWLEAGRINKLKTKVLDAALELFWQQNCTAYRFGRSTGEKAWGLCAFLPDIHFRFLADGTGMLQAEFWQTMHDVGNSANILCEGGADIKLFGYFGSGGRDGKHNWLEVKDSFKGPISFYAKTIQQSFINHPFRFTDSQVKFYDEVSLAEGKKVHASSTAPGSAPSYALDRNPRTVWTALAGSTLTVDLGEVKTINRFAIENAGLFSEASLSTAEAELHVSVDNVTFVKVGRVFAHRNAQKELVPLAWFDAPLDPTPARYVKLVVTNPGADGKIRVASFQVFEVTGKAVNGSCLTVADGAAVF